MNENKVIITCGSKPDADGLGCAAAYSEFLNKTQNDKKYSPLFYSKGQIETEYLWDKLGLRYDLNYSNRSLDCPIILVDASEAKGLPNWVNFDCVVEAIDHRLFPDYTSFKNARFQIEPVGAAATLIAEKYYYQKIPISKLSGTLLLAGIYSNTNNFVSKNTTFRDIKMKKWLESLYPEAADTSINMLRYKTDYVSSNIETALVEDSKRYSDLTVYQLELLESMNARQSLEIILNTSDIFKKDYLLLFQDIREKCTYIYCNKMKLIDKLNLKIETSSINGFLWKTNELYMRKDILSLVL